MNETDEAITDLLSDLIESVECLRLSVDNLTAAMDGTDYGIDFEPDFPMDTSEIN